MKLYHLAVVSTTVVILLGLLLVIPVFFLGNAEGQRQEVMLSISIQDDVDMPGWCDELAESLVDTGIKVTIFIVGYVAEKYPQCVERLADNENLDIGSQTYSNFALTTLHDYEQQMREVSEGKKAVNKAGRLDSRAFKAPLGQTDENIYSLLNRSNIHADFSYSDHYNKLNGEYYIWFNITSYDDESLKLSKQIRTDLHYPAIVDFDNHDSVIEIQKFALAHKSEQFQFVNASDLTGLQLTLREGQVSN